MSELLFLDAARMGRPSQRTIAAQMSLHQFWAEHGLSSANDALLWAGWPALDAASRSRYFGLADWQGVDELKRRLLESMDCAQPAEVVLATSASRLFEHVARTLLDVPRRVLYPDCLWPAFRSLLRTYEQSFSFQLQEDPARMLDSAVSALERNRCEVVVLPGLTHLGVPIPYAKAIDAMAAISPETLFLVDGAQEYGHLPAVMPSRGHWLYIASTQKWLSSGAPMGIGLASKGMAALLAESRRLATDPLYGFATGEQKPFGETVSIAPLFMTRAALAELDQVSLESRLATRLLNRKRLGRAFKLKGLNCSEFATGMLTIDLGERGTLDPVTLRSELMRQGIVASTFPEHIVRFSMPEYELTEGQLERVHRALSYVVGDSCSEKATSYDLA